MRKKVLEKGRWEVRGLVFVVGCVFRLVLKL